MRRVIVGAGLVMGMLGGMARPGEAQNTAAAADLVGQRVRVRSCRDGGCARVTGVLLGMQAEALHIGVAADSMVAVPRAAVQRLEQSLGTRRRVTKGLLVGAGVGLGAGLLASGAWIAASGVECGYEFDCGALVTVAGGAGLALGGVIGLTVGALTRSERWVDVGTERLTVAPVGGSARTGIALSLRF